MPLSLREASPVPTFSIAQSSSGSRNGTSPPVGQGTNPAEYILEKDQNLFGAQLLVMEPGKALLRCTKCSKVVSEAAGAEHIRICNHLLNGTPLSNKKTVKKTESVKRRASEGSEETDSPKNKRQKLPDDLAQIPPLPSFKNMKKSEIKKVKKERERLEKQVAKIQAKNDAQERKRMRASEPIDLDRQCGVINDKGLPCSRSLTCKTHTVGAKRSVEGRSKAYDSLYLEWQRANNPNFKEPQKGIRKDKTDTEKKKPGRKKWEFSMSNMVGGDHEGIGEGEEGQREFEEMIMFAKIGGDRCRLAIQGFGSGWDTMPGGQVRAAKQKKVNGTVSATTKLANGTGPALAPVTAGANPALVSTPVNKGTIPFSVDAIFKTALTEFNGVGDTMTKALATRAVDGHAAMKAGGSRGIPPTMTTGVGMRPSETKQSSISFTVTT